MKRYPESPAEIRKVLQQVVDGTDGTYEIDDCFSGPPFSNPKLEAMRQRLWNLPDEFPPERKGLFCGQKGMEVIRGWIEDLSQEKA
jgi:hypothetical protein